MIVILCHPDDVAALWLSETLQQLGVDGVELVAVEQLVFSRRIVYHLSGDGDSGRIELADGRVLRPETISGLVNRIQYLPTQHFANADPADRNYAAAELSAFVLAWINGVGGRVINPALPFALGGGGFQMPTLVQLASMAGLPTVPWRASTADVGPPEGGHHVGPSEAGHYFGPPEGGPYISTHAGIVFDGRLFGPLLPRGLQDACRQLAVLLGVPLLQVMLHQSPGLGWRFVNATGSVDFRIGGKPLALAIGRALARRIAA